MFKDIVIKDIILVLSPIIGLFGVWLGSHFSRKNSLRVEKLFMVKKIKIEKLQEVSKILLEYLRTIAQMEINIVKFLSNEIDHKGLKVENNRLQNEATNLHRILTVNIVFVKEIKSKLDIFYNDYWMICDKIYEKYHNPETKKRMYKDHELEWEIIESDFVKCLLTGNDIVTMIHSELEKELNDLM